MPISPTFDLASMWHAMGVFARAVALALTLMGVYSVAVCAERLVTFARAAAASRRYAERLRNLLPDGRFADAVALARELRRGPVAQVLGLALEEYQRGLADAGALAARDDLIPAVTRAVERSSLRAVADLRRGLGALATVGSTAPFVGLLGTVAGIITAFQSMAVTGSGGLASVSAGIAEALVTTAFGLLVAIPAVMMFNYLTVRVEDIELDVEDAAAELVDHLIKRRDRADAGGVA